MKSFSSLSIYVTLMFAVEVLSVPFIVEIETGTSREIGTAHKCRQCLGEDCFILPEPCKFGSFVDKCGFVNCYQGPGGFCTSDPTGAYRCAKQLSCLCNECRGCLKDPDDGEYHCNRSPPCGGLIHPRPEK